MEKALDSYQRPFRDVVSIAIDGIKYNSQVNPKSRYDIFMEVVTRIASAKKIMNGDYETLVSAFAQADTNGAISKTSRKGMRLRKIMADIEKDIEPDFLYLE